MNPSPALDYYLSAVMDDRLREAAARRRHRGFDFTPLPRRSWRDRLRALLARVRTLPLPTGDNSATSSAQPATEVPR